MASVDGVDGVDGVDVLDGVLDYLLRNECGNDVVEIKHVFLPKQTSSNGQCDQLPTEAVHPPENFYSFLG